MGKWAAPHPSKREVERTCEACGEIFHTRQWKINQGKGKYCSKPCYRIGSRGEGVMYDGLWFGINGKNNYHWHKRPDKTSVSLHKYIWEKHNCPCPEGHVIHHIDHDPTNNAIENLVLMEEREHARLHLQKRIDEGTIDVADNLAKAREKAKAWHSSPEGQEWHRRHGRRVAANLSVVDHICVECGVQYQAKEGKRKKGYCSPACQSRARRKSGVDNEVRTCLECGEKFSTNKYGKTKSCSRECGMKQMVKARA